MLLTNLFLYQWNKRRKEKKLIIKNIEKEDVKSEVKLTEKEEVKKEVELELT